jgi:hypothetical protein
MSFRICPVCSLPNPDHVILSEYVRALADIGVEGPAVAFVKARNSLPSREEKTLLAWANFFPSRREQHGSQAPDCPKKLQIRESTS